MLCAMTKTKATTPPPPQRRNSMVPVGDPVGRLTRPVFGRHGFAGGALVMDWPVIVGSALAAYTLPQRIQFPPGERSGGVLHVKVASSAFAPQIVHLEPLILERINGYFGWKAVDRLRLHHGPLPRPLPRRQTAPTTPAELPESTKAALEKVSDLELREILMRIGQRIARNS